MPKGQKLVIWTPENETKLFHAILAVHKLELDYGKIAAIFGPNIPALCISQHMWKLRRKVAENFGGNAAPSSTSTVEKKARVPAPTKTNKGRKNDGMLNEKTSNNEPNEDVKQESTPIESADSAKNPFSTPRNRNKVISGRVRKARVSPRQSVKPDYKKLGDPFVGMDEAKDEHGNNIFGNDESGSEDTYPSDAEFRDGEEVYGGEEEVVVKEEEEAV